MSKRRQTEAAILTHHEHLAGSLRCRRLKSKVLGIHKPFYVYEPPGFKRSDAIPVVYLFRGHEREWVNIAEDNSRGVSTAIEDIDLLITLGLLPPVLLVMPGISSSNNATHSLGIDMVGPGIGERGIGTGKFWTYLTTEFIPTIENRYPGIAPGQRMAIGFSLGGYLTALLATCFPGYLDHAGIFDGTLPYRDFKYPELKASSDCSDRVWCESPLLDPALGKPRRLGYMRRWNVTDIVRRASFHDLHLMRKTRFWVSSASEGGNRGNLDRSRHFVEAIKDADLPVGTRGVAFASNASHTWHWADMFAVSLIHRVLVDGGRPVSKQLYLVAKHLLEQTSAASESAELG